MGWYNADFGLIGFQVSVLHAVIKGTLEIMEVKLRKLDIINHIFAYFGLPHNFMPVYYRHIIHVNSNFLFPLYYVAFI